MGHIGPFSMAMLHNQIVIEKWKDPETRPIHSQQFQFTKKQIQ